ncbi:MAG: T9SS type A sorting domain-containing protein [Ignavibacteriales bacterium]|nr:T9SS type A sorting domain-containing protein [Ignavibacteriales bacterium]
MKITKIILSLAAFIILISQSAFAQNYSGVNSCKSCHSNAGAGRIQYTQWAQTLHSIGYDSLPSVKNQIDCAPCHLTGWDTTKANKGADDYITNNLDGTFTVANTTEFAKKINVQCENCHGPVQIGSTAPANHPATGPIKGSLQNPNAELCGGCHKRDQQPTYPEWQISKHAFSDTNASPFLTNMFRSDSSCSGCHTYQGFMEFIKDTINLVPHVTSPPGNAAVPLSCVACHDPHSKAIDKQLRIAKDQLCQKCHNPEYDPANPTPGNEVHNTASYMFEAKGGYEYAGYNYQSSPHKDVITDKCITCHMFSAPYNGPSEPAKTGHTFEPSGKSCVGCHSDFDTLATTFDYRGVQTMIDSIANVLSLKLAAASPADSTTDEFKRAKFNYDFVMSDLSRGIHNTQYAQGLLESAIANFTPSNAVKIIDDGIPSKFELAQNYPNPFNPTTKIIVDLPRSGNASLIIYDILGNRIATLMNGTFKPGKYEIAWNGSNDFGSVVPSGVYIYKFEAGSFTQTKKMLFMK